MDVGPYIRAVLIVAGALGGIGVLAHKYHAKRISVWEGLAGLCAGLAALAGIVWAPPGPLVPAPSKPTPTAISVVVSPSPLSPTPLPLRRLTSHPHHAVNDVFSPNRARSEDLSTVAVELGQSIRAYCKRPDAQGDEAERRFYDALSIVVGRLAAHHLTAIGTDPDAVALQSRTCDSMLENASAIEGLAQQLPVRH